MKKYLLSLAVLLAGTSVLFTSCNDDDDMPTVRIVAVNKGVYVVNSGNQNSNIASSLTYVEAGTWSSISDAFLAANGQSLGNTANDAVVYGGKVYVAVTGSNTIEVIDNNTMKSQRQLSTTDLMGSDKGKQPRHLMGGGRWIFVSTFDGYVAAIDTATYSVYKTYKVGSYPEGLDTDGRYIYVANSDYGRGNGSLSVIDFQAEDGNVQEYKFATLPNPVDVAVTTKGVFVLDSGTYDENWNQNGAGVYKVNSEGTSATLAVADATSMAVNGTKIYVICNPYSSSSVTVPAYKVYDASTGNTTNFLADGNPSTNSNAPFSPNAIAVDPVENYVYVASYDKNPETGYAGYSLPGKLYIYDTEGSLKATCATGVGPTAVVPNTGYKYEY